MEGVSFLEWFPCFIQQLGCYSRSGSELPARISIPNTFEYRNAKIPFMSFNSSDWDPQLKKYLIEEMKINLGSFTGSQFGCERRDLNAQIINLANPTNESKDKLGDDEFVCEVPARERRSLKKNNFIVGECKLWAKEVTGSGLKDIIMGMQNCSYEGKINLITVWRFTKTLSNLDQIANIYHLERNEKYSKQNTDDTIPKFFLKQICKCENANKVYILIALSEIHDDKEELKKTMYLFRK